MNIRIIQYVGDEARRSFRYATNAEIPDTGEVVFDGNCIALDAFMQIISKHNLIAVNDGGVINVFELPPMARRQAS